MEDVTILNQVIQDITKIDKRLLEIENQMEYLLEQDLLPGQKSFDVWVAERVAG